MLVCRKASKKCKRPFKFINIDGGTAVTQTDRKRITFRETCVKPFIDPVRTDEDFFIKSRDMVCSATGEEKYQRSETNPGYKEADAKLNRKSNIYNADDSKVDTNNKFVQPKCNELRCLVANGPFEVVSREQPSIYTRVFDSSFINEMKHANVGAQLKSRLVAPNRDDKDASTTAIKGPTVPHLTGRLIISMASSLCKLSAHSSDVAQAYIQSKSPFERNVYIRPSKQMGIPSDHVVKVVKPLSGISESV